MNAQHVVTSYHEACHASMARILGYEVASVDRADAPGRHGQTLFRCGNDLDAQVVLIAPIVDAQGMTDYDPAGFGDDCRKAMLLGPIDEAVDRARVLVRDPKYVAARRAIDAALWAKARLTGEEVRELMR